MVLNEGATIAVALIAEAPSGTLSAWVLEVEFDPDVVQTAPRDCDPVNTPSGAIGAVGCDVADENDDGDLETVKTFGAIVYRDDGDGFSNGVVLADITFDVVGSPGECSDLDISVTSFLNADGDETNPAVDDGEICVAGGNVTPPPTPVGGTPTRPPDPPPDGGVSSPTAPGGTDGQTAGPNGTPGNGDTPPPGTDDGDTGVTGTNDASDTISPNSLPGAGDQPGETGADGQPIDVDEDDDGGSAVLPVVGAVVGLGVIGAAAFAVARLRSREPIEEAPSGSGESDTSGGPDSGDTGGSAA